MVKFKRGDKVEMTSPPVDWEDADKILGAYFHYYHTENPSPDNQERTDCTLLIIYLDEDDDMSTSHWDVNSKDVGLHLSKSGKFNFRFNRGAL